MQQLIRAAVFSLAAVVIASAAAGQTKHWLFVSLLREKRIVTFSRDEQTGQLERRGVTDCPAEPACMSVSPDRKILFVSLRSTGELASFRIDPESGRLRLISRVAGGSDPAYLRTDRSGQYLVSAYYESDKVAVHRVDESGAIAKSPLQTIATADKAHGIAFDSRDRAVFVPHTGANRIYQFRFDKTSGRLTPSNPIFLAAVGDKDHPRHLAIHPSDRWAYASHEAGDSLGVYAVDAGNGTLSHLQTVTSIPADFDGSRNATARCEMTPDGRFVYVANRGHDSIAGYAIDPMHGRVRPIGFFPTEQTPRSFTITASGRYLYAAGQGSGRIAAFRIGNDGTLDRFATYDSGPVSWWIIAVDTVGSN